MNKFGMVLGVAAVATLSGCKDPDYKYASTSASQTEAKSVETVAVEPAAAKCNCPPGTKHASPCTCDASDCKCVVEQKPAVTADVSKPAEVPAAAAPVEPEYTIYVVQSGDYLAKISKKFNVTIASIKRLNPSIQNNVIRVGQKLKLPGKIDIPASAAAAAAPVAKTASAKKGFVPYTGATKEYVVKSGDTLGSIAYGSGIKIRQLKELNGLSSDGLKVGQKLKIPAAKVEKAAAKAKKATAAEPKAVKAVAEAKAEVAAPVPAEEPAKVEADAAVAPAAVETAAEAPKAEADAVAPAEKVEPPAPAAATATYVVQEGDDMTSVSIRWGVSAADIRELNNLGENDQLVPGQIIKLPAEAQQ